MAFETWKKNAQGDLVLDRLCTDEMLVSPDGTAIAMRLEYLVVAEGGMGAAQIALSLDDAKQFLLRLQRIIEQAEATPGATRN